MIKIGENYKLGTMPHNIVLFGKPEVNKEKSDRMKEMLRKIHGDKVKSDEDDNVEKGWTPVAYFGNIVNAFNYIITLEIEKSDLKDLETVVDAVKNSMVNINKATEKLTLTLGESMELIDLIDKVEMNE